MAERRAPLQRHRVGTTREEPPEPLGDDTTRRLRTAGWLLFAYGALGFLWPFAPMHLRETLAAGGGTLSDDMHIALAAVTQTIYFLALILTAAALGKAFRIYSIATFVVLVFFGALTFIEAPGIAKNEPTPMIGVWERINIGVFLIWVVVLAVVLWPQKTVISDQYSVISDQ
mgnify:CR=1 FL=1